MLEGVGRQLDENLDIFKAAAPMLLLPELKDFRSGALSTAARVAKRTLLGGSSERLVFDDETIVLEK